MPLTTKAAIGCLRVLTLLTMRYTIISTKWRVLMRSDGSAVLTGASAASLYLP